MRLRLEHQTHKKLNELAKKNRRTKHNQIVFLVELALELKTILSLDPDNGSRTDQIMQLVRTI
jgi:predicted transcriptional regulator